MTKKTLTAALAAALITAGAVTAAAPAQAAVQLEIPAVTGQSPVGREVLHLVDGDRVDPWTGKGPRELMVSMYYPARPGGGSTAQYMTTEEARLLLRGQKRDQPGAAEMVSATKVNAKTGAAPARGRHPLVVLSPGFTLPRGLLTGLAEDLASRGYVVAAVDHANESYGTAFPGGRITTCVACDKVKDGGLAKVAGGRAKDVSFLLDRLTGPRPAWPYAKMIDKSRIGMAGHSIGGNAAAQVMAEDRRVRAGVNLDGTFFTPVDGLKRPFMMVGTRSGHSPGGVDASWDRSWPELGGWKRWLTVEKTGHLSFVDLPVLGAQLGMVDPAAPLSGRRSGEIPRAYVGAFFDRHLKGEKEPLLDGPTEDNPEVAFHRP